MRPARESRPILIGAILAVLTLFFFAVALGATLMVARQPDEAEPAVQDALTQRSATATVGSVVEAAASPPALLDTTAPPTTPAAGTNTTVPTNTAASATTAASITIVPTVAPVTATATRLPPTATVELSSTTALSPTVAPSPTLAASPTPAVVAAVYWPERLPQGMTLAVEEAWPFRSIAPGREREPFLLFRDQERWLVVRNLPGAPEPIPASATRSTIQVEGTPATLITYADGGLKVLWQRGDQTVQVSGAGLTETDIREVTASLRPVTAEELHTRLRQAIAAQQLRVTLLWPGYLPAGVQLVPAETVAQLAPAADGVQNDAYRVSFRDGQRLLQLGGGQTALPQLAGRVEPVTDGLVTGTLTSAGQRHLLVIDGGTSPTLKVPPPPAPNAQRRLPLVQQGRVFVLAENLDRAQFDHVVANLFAVRPQDFAARARGQNISSLPYLWPAKLPPGYTLDVQAVQVAWDDFLLQGGRPYFALTANGPNGATVVIKGGREPGGTTFVVPEGGDVERSTPTVRGRPASAARTAAGVLLVWTEADAVYAMTSPTLTIEQLVAISEGLEVVDAAEVFRRAQ